MIDYRINMRKMIEFGNGVISEDLFVEKPGVGILYKTELPPNTHELFQNLNIDVSKEEYEQIGEFNGRITYNNFPTVMKDSTGFTDSMVNLHQHLSVYSSICVTFLIAGVSIETVLEFVAHHESNIARLTSSKTKAMNETFYRLQGDDKEREIQKKVIKHFKKMRDEFKQSEELKTEFMNMFNLSTKVGAFTITMNVKDWHKTLIGRLKTDGVETEVREVCEEICRQLNGLYPSVIKKVDDYYQLSNGEKYKM